MGTPRVVHLSTRRFAGALAAFVVLLVVLNLLLGLHQFVAGRDAPSPFLSVFDVDSEESVATWFAVVLLALSTLLLVVISAVKRDLNDPFRRYWYGLVLTFTFLSIDEQVALHERLIEPLRSALHTSGPFYFAWVIPAAVLVTVFAAVYFRFLLHLPSHTQIHFVAAAILYVGGALGLEMLGGYLLGQFGPGLMTGPVAIIEEACEFAGVVVFIYGLLAYLATLAPTLTFQLDD